MKLNENELRVIGCLIEKSLTTPDQYPLSLNALTNACNQKSNREPVLTLTESDVQNTVDTLSSKGLIMNQSGASSRVAKYKHRFCNTEFGDIQLSAQELGVICVLFLRGPQTPGELRTRTNRLCEFSDVHETEQVLQELMAGDKVIRLEREPGKRESRYAHCFGESMIENHDSDAQTTVSSGDISDSSKPEFRNDSRAKESENSITRIAALEEKTELMQLEIDELREMLAKLTD